MNRTQFLSPAVTLAIAAWHAPDARAQAQTTAFEVASIKPSQADPGSTSGIKTGHGLMDAHNVTLKRCIMGAYGVGPRQISGGPDWIDSDRFEIYAKAGQPTNGDAELMILLRNLLADRFKLTLHRETRATPAFILEVAKNGPKLQKVEPGEAGTNTSNSNTGVAIDAHHTDMDSLARTLGRQTDLPVVNQTGLDGVFNFKLHWTPDKVILSDPASPETPALFTAIQEQLGLRLRRGRAPIQFIVIDRAEKPSPN